MILGSAGKGRIVDMESSSDIEDEGGFYKGLRKFIGDGDSSILH